MPGISLSLNADMTTQGTSATGGVAVNDAFDHTVIFPKCTSGKLQGSSDGGSTYGDIAGTAFTGDGTICPSVSLERCPFDHVLAIFAGSGGIAIHIRQHLRNQPKVGLDRTKNKTIVGPALGTA